MTTQQFEIWNAETFPPVVWDIRKNVRFQDIKEENWDKALEFLKSQYFGRHVLCKKGLQLEEKPKVVEELCGRVKSIFKDACSLIAVDQETDQICGVAALRVLYNDSSRPWGLWRATPTTHEEIQKYVDFEYKLSQFVYNVEHDYIQSALHLFIVCIDVEKKGKLLKDDLLEMSYNVARSMGVNAMTYFTFTKNDEIRALRLEMHAVDYIPYRDYLDDKDKVIFDGLEPDYTATCFMREVEPKKITSCGGRRSLFEPEEYDFSTIIDPRDL